MKQRLSAALEHLLFGTRFSARASRAESTQRSKKKLLLTNPITLPSAYYQELPQCIKAPDGLSGASKALANSGYFIP